MDLAVVATLIFALTYALIATELVHKTVAALGGAVVVIVIRLLSQEDAFRAVDWNVIFLLASMMIIADIARRTGIFQWLAVRTIKMARGDPFWILASLSIVTAVVSAFLDNVTTVVLIAPLTIYMAQLFQMSPVPFLTAEFVASNMGGTATLIGDPPNIMIGSHAGLDFVAFVLNQAPTIILVLMFFVPAAWLLFRRDLHVPPELKGLVMSMSEREMITDPGLLLKALVVLGLALVGFIFHGALGYEPATVALAGAVSLLWWGKVDVREVFNEVEWPTLFFFVGLFIIVESLATTGVISAMAQFMLGLTGGSLPLTGTVILWFSGFASGIVDNIPFTATMLPLVAELGAHMPVESLWWSLSLGACLGGNFTLVGASANVVVAHMSERAGYPISFKSYLKYGIPLTFGSLIISNLTLWLRYWL